MRRRESAIFQFGSVASLTATVTATGGKDTATVKIYVATDISLKSIDYTTDHGMLRRMQTGDNKFGSTGAGRYHDVEWMAGNWADPLTHSMGTRVGIEATLKGIPAGISYSIIGNADGTDLDFVATGVKGSKLQLTAKSSLARTIDQIDKPISWRIVIDGESISLGESRNLIYVTFGTPRGITWRDTAKEGAFGADAGVVTEKRIAWLTGILSGESDAQRILEIIHRETLSLGSFDLGNNPRVWAVLDGKPAECKDHVRVIHACVNLLGMPSGRIGYVFPTTTSSVIRVGGRDVRVSLGNLSEDPFRGYEVKPNDTEYQLRYRDSNGDANRYEAVYEYGGKYYGGFSERVANTVQEVMLVAKNLVWINFRTGNEIDFPGL